MKKTERLRYLLRRFRNAQRRALYWSGNPSFLGKRAKASNSGAMHERYELAMCDQDSLARLIQDLGVTVTIRDYKAEFRKRFYQRMTTPTDTTNRETER